MGFKEDDVVGKKPKPPKKKKKKKKNPTTLLLGRVQVFREPDGPFLIPFSSHAHGVASLQRPAEFAASSTLTTEQFNINSKPEGTNPST